jgi:hypothetical protein
MIKNIYLFNKKFFLIITKFDRKLNILIIIKIRYINVYSNINYSFVKLR